MDQLEFIAPQYVDRLVDAIAERSKLRGWAATR